MDTNLELVKGTSHGDLIIREVPYEGGVTIQYHYQDGTAHAQDVEEGWQSDLYDIPCEFDALVDQAVEKPQNLKPYKRKVQMWQLAVDRKMTATQWFELFGPAEKGEFDRFEILPKGGKKEWKFQSTAVASMSDYEFQRFSALKWDWAREALSESIAEAKSEQTPDEVGRALLSTSWPEWVRCGTGDPAGPPHYEKRRLEYGSGYIVWALLKSNEVYIEATEIYYR